MLNRRGYSISKYRFILCIVLLVIGYLIGVYFPFTEFPIKDNTPITKHNYWLLLIEIFMAIGTFATIIVALFKESILKYINKPSLKVDLIDNGITEDLDENSGTPIAKSYRCILSIENVGNAVAQGCEVFLSKISYKRDTNADMREIRGLEGKKKLDWESTKVDIPQNITKEILLFTLHKINDSGNPESSGVPIPAILFNGVNLNIEKRKKGQWRLDYYVKLRNGNHTSFSLNVKWSGEWKTRGVDFQEVLKIELN